MIYDAGDCIYASSSEEAEEVANQRGWRVRVNTEFSVVDLLEEYWFPQDWPYNPAEDIVWIVEP